MTLAAIIARARPAWFDQAACRGVALAVFFPGQGRSAMPARNICQHCPVSTPCLDYALADPALVGVFGGTTESERDHIRTRRSNHP
jgi:WhiB family redox-sensing transcriptional regulator